MHRRIRPLGNRGENFLNQLYHRYRASSSEQVLTFPSMVYLTADALLHYHGRGRRCFQEGRRQGTLEPSITAAFGKLQRFPAL